MLPITDIFSELDITLGSGDHIIVAPPGAGKSTELPLHLLKHPSLNGQKILMLQPRRIAARSIAQYLAGRMNEKVGDTVGYRIRGENHTSSSTRLEIVTEGVLTRMLQHQPELPGIGLIIFDEFHERNMHADFSLALCLEVQQALREDLRLIIMSATLEVSALQSLLPEAQLLEAKGRSFPIDIQYTGKVSNKELSQTVVNTLLDVLPKHEKDILVFLPGAYEINKVAGLLSKCLSQDNENHAYSISKIDIHCLYSELNKQMQDAALRPSQSGRRKVILATNIAETSLTIDGIEAVIDSGIEKKAIYDLRRGFTHLASQAISQASASQRAGRAGRLMAGTCYRMWDKETHHRLARQSTPDILQTEISSFLLEALVWGSDFSDLALLDTPSSAQIAQARDTLRGLGIIDEREKLTSLGKVAHNLGANPNIAVMLLKSKKLSEAHVSLACAIAALLESKDPMPDSPSVELQLRLAFLLENRSHPIWMLIKQWQRKAHSTLHSPSENWPLEDCGLLLAFAFPQWIAKQRSRGLYSMANGSGGALKLQDPLSEERWLVVGNMHTTEHQSGDAIVRLAQALSLSQIEAYFSHMVSEQELVQWNEEKQKILAEKVVFLGKIRMHKQPLPQASQSQLNSVWEHLLLDKGIHALPFDDRTKLLIERVKLAKSVDDAFPDFSEQGLLAYIDTWFTPYLQGLKSWKQIGQLSFYQQLRQSMDYAIQQKLDSLLPESIDIPIGRKAKLDYRDNNKVVLSVRMQELYGLQTHPCLLNGKLPITIELLSPAQRPIQTTEDIVGFWSGSYREVQKEMKGRYPRHFWPDEPMKAPATSTTKKRMEQKQ
ncbi:ATP-dependent helicase HrpB [Alteromonas sp. W364]|uniref:ATP-dependent helicase HrpB n=1 Tax=Alteromonas sp. W364 TaxID=3075610 RepID=UPI002886AC74|nr:ATP-dependent helicase HrpB [Alteromonas sp. W364]MDT0627278.1 ATP-dependent helicase HrpB [Alteromonas sp. W364]